MSSQPVIDNQALREQIKQFLDKHLPEYIAKYVKDNEIRLKELSLVERIVRVEEELKHLRVFEAERHESLIKEMNARFEAMNSRFEAMNARFEALERRFSFMQWLIAGGKAPITLLTTIRFFIN